MNDRFKFRFWAKPHEPTKTEGYYVDDADYMVMTPYGKVQIEYYCDNGYAGYIDSFEQDEIIVEQCTGLKDKNGKLIYEGDICIPAKDMADNYGEIYRAESGTYSIKGKMKNGMEYDFGIYWHISDYEVVGNIHENEELLK